LGPGFAKNSGVSVCSTADDNSRNCNCQLFSIKAKDNQACHIFLLRLTEAITRVLTKAEC